MNNKKNIYEMIRKWGKNNQKLPSDNLILKNKILSGIPDEPAENSHSKTHALLWFPLALAAIAVIIFIGGPFGVGNYMQNVSVSLPTAQSLEKETSSYPAATSVSNQDTSGASYVNENEGSQYGLPITDSREFLKTNYNASVRTRNVPGTMEKIEMIVRGLGGRIDSSSGGEEYGHISYAIPAEKLPMFKKEIREVTGKKLFTEEISSENLLPEKQSIEEERLQAESTLITLQKERTQIISSHQKTSRLYELRIADIKNEMGMLQAEWQSASASRQNQINRDLARLQIEKNTMESELGSENRNYQNKLSGVDGRIRSSQSDLGHAKEQDKDLIANVATVNGDISLSWISLWGIAEVYTPGALLGWILLITAFLFYVRHGIYRRIDLY